MIRKAIEQPLQQRDTELESRIREYGGRLVQSRWNAGGWTRNRVDGFLSRLMEDKPFRIQALRFIDVLPALEDDEDLLRHLRDYFGKEDLKLALPLKWALGARALQGPLLAKAVRRAALMLSKRFIVGIDPLDAMRAVAELRRRGIGFSLDLLGEAVLGEAEAERYLRSYLRLIEETAPALEKWPGCEILDCVGGREGPRLYLSLKLTSLCSRIDPSDPKRSIRNIAARLRPLLRAARERHAFVCIDMEQYDYKGIVLESFKALLMEEEFRDWPDAGIALQAYLRETERDLQGLIDWVDARGAPVTVRLVRGAYWDYETIAAAQHGWPSPVWDAKEATDACYERCMELLMANSERIRPAIASHNLRSLAKAMALAERHGLSADRFEFQMLYGMADSLKARLTEMGYCLRLYIPFGEPIPGMAYLVRRLLENASGQSLLFSQVHREKDLERLLAAPEPASEAAPGEKGAGEAPKALPPFRNEPHYRFIGDFERRVFAAALDEAAARLGRVYPLIIDGREVETGRHFDSVNPARPGELIGRVAKAGREEADRAVEGAAKALEPWSGLEMAARAGVLLRAALLLRERRAAFAAREILEAGKTWREADANVTETIDFLEYYARQGLRLGRGRSVNVPGEMNFNGYRALGVGVILPPWNFPSAILMGMLSAAIVCGNTAILKPSSQTPVIAAHLVNLLREAGVPDGVVQYLPGSGGEVGEYLVGHPGIRFVAFTGSEAVGSRILRIAAQQPPSQPHIKRVVAEMGGKNAIMVDSDANPDEVIKGVVHSAFSYQGQKCSACSRLIIVGARHDAIVKRLADAASSLEIGMPDQPGVFMGPVIEKAAKERILDAIDAGRLEAELVLQRECSGLGDGYFVGPAIFVGVSPDSMLGQQEIFGPVLSVFEARTLDEAIEIANSTRYALTGGFYSRSPANIEKVKRRFEVGNLYINRGITGALVNRQAFGGFKMSGHGYKAGGPDYLLQFMNQTTWTENTLRHGFAPG